MASSLEEYCKQRNIILANKLAMEWLAAPVWRQVEIELEHKLLWRPEATYAMARVEEGKCIEPTVANSVEATLAQRGSRYGDFTDHARLCQALMLEMQEFKPEGTPAGGLTKWEQLSPVQRQALTVIADKIARILSGDPNYDDNWHDIQGYAKLVEDRLPKKDSN